MAKAPSGVAPSFDCLSSVTPVKRQGQTPCQHQGALGSIML